MAAGKVEVLLVVGGFDVDGGAEARLVNKDVNIQEGDMGRGDGPGKSERVETGAQGRGEGNHDHESTTRRYHQ